MNLLRKRIHIKVVESVMLSLRSRVLALEQPNLGLGREYLVKVTVGRPPVCSGLQRPHCPSLSSVHKGVLARCRTCSIKLNRQAAVQLLGGEEPPEQLLNDTVKFNIALANITLSR